MALAGRSAALDPRTHAFRPDLADVRLADRIFAPHYAEPVKRRVATATSLREGRDTRSAEVAKLLTGEPFELLDVIGDAAWGIAPDRGLVGYLPAADLDRAGG